MDKIKVTEDNIRLDTIVYNHYGDLTMFDEVFKANPHLTAPILPIDTVIVLPVQEKKDVEKALW